MAYTRHHWVCGETVTAELLNNIEDGIEEALACCSGGGGDTVTITVSPQSEMELYFSRTEEGEGETLNIGESMTLEKGTIIWFGDEVRLESGEALKACGEADKPYTVTEDITVLSEPCE